MADLSIEKLKTIVSPHTFLKGDCICYEGQPEDEMYFILSGSAGIYTSTLLGESVKTSTVGKGDFFGEMTLFDKLPRTITAIALEDTVCAAVGRRHLRQLIANCPDVIEKLLTTYSQKNQELSDRLYKRQNPDVPLRFKNFPMPQPNQSHSCSKPEKSSQFVELFQAECPVCHGSILLQSMKMCKLPKPEVLLDQRRKYEDFEPLWFTIWGCTECGYTNYYKKFFRGYSCSLGEMRQVISIQRQCKRAFDCKTTFDELLFSYYCAIHTNECVNGGDAQLLGKLWLCLSWLYHDVGNTQLQATARYNAIDYFLAAHRQSDWILPTQIEKQQCAIALAELYRMDGNLKSAKLFYHEVLKYEGKRLAQAAYDRLYEMKALPERIVLK